MIKRFLLLLLMALPLVSAQADGFQFLAFQTQNGAVQTLPVTGLRITFSNGQLVATDGTSALTLPLSELSKMFFSESEVTAIESIAVSEGRNEGAVYNLQGVRVGSIRNGEMSLQGLPRGIYIVTRQGRTEKISIP